MQLAMSTSRGRSWERKCVVMESAVLKGKLKSEYFHFLAVWLGTCDASCPSLSLPSVNGVNYSLIIGLMYRLNEVMEVRCLLQCLPAIYWKPSGRRPLSPVSMSLYS